MGTRGHIGHARPDDPTTLLLRYVHSDASASDLLVALQDIHHRTFAGDITAMLNAVMAHDWVYLDADTTAHDTAMTGDEPVPGVGMALPTNLTDGTVTVPTDKVGDLDSTCVCLIDADARTITALIGDAPATVLRLT